jgi:hypothetical protein
MKEGDQQVQKTSERLVPDQADGYIQNAEQDENSVWKTIRQDK